ncbi:hypothetical protein ABW19_dt0205973 [Dactylella cylindrospora]|nr:hypothetical protein ABW19_dt0205973 [Dactylella cylindrospora]
MPFEIHVISKGINERHCHLCVRKGKIRDKRRVSIQKKKSGYEKKIGYYMSFYNQSFLPDIVKKVKTYKKLRIHDLGYHSLGKTKSKKTTGKISQSRKRKNPNIQKS